MNEQNFAPNLMTIQTSNDEYQATVTTAFKVFFTLLFVSFSVHTQASSNLSCWGWDGWGQTTVPEGAYKQVSVNGYHTCALKEDNTLACWGLNSFGQASPPTGSFQYVNAGTYHACAIKPDNSLVCWGHNFFGESTPPVGKFQQVSGNTFYTCALRIDNTLACWGYNDSGQATPPSGSFKQVSAGNGYACAVKMDDTLACWGSQSTPPAGTFKQVSAGDTHTCGVKMDSTLACWGDNTYRQSTPPPGRFIQVSAGWEHTCAVKTDNSLVCWGHNNLGQATQQFGHFKQVSAEGRHSCAVKEATLHAIGVTPHAIRLSWDDISDIEKGFRIQRKTGACDSTNPWLTHASQEANTTRKLATFLDWHLPPENQYSYRVSSYYGTDIFSDYSQCASATTGAIETPHVPISLRAVSMSNTRINLHWHDFSGNETAFNIYRQTNSDSMTLLDTVAEGTQSYSDTTAAGNNTTTTYHYDVRACNPSGCSMPYTPMVVPFEPTDLKATVSATVQLSWKDKSNNESGFKIWRKNGDCVADSPWVELNTVAANTKRYNDDSTVSAQEYSYKVRAYYFTGTIPWGYGYSRFTRCVSVNARNSSVYAGESSPTSRSKGHAAR